MKYSKLKKKDKITLFLQFELIQAKGSMRSIVIKFDLSKNGRRMLSETEIAIKILRKPYSYK